MRNLLGKGVAVVLVYINRWVRALVLLAGGLAALWLLVYLSMPLDHPSPPVDLPAATAGSGEQVGLGLVVAWGDENVGAVLRQLEQSDTRVTFFLTAAWTRVHPELAAMMVAAGHELATAGGQQTDYTLFPRAYVREQLHDGVDALTEVTGVSPRLVALPHDRHNRAVREAAAEVGLAVVAAARHTPQEGDAAPRAAARVAGQLVAGQVLLVEISDDYGGATALVEAVIRELQQAGTGVGPVSRALSIDHAAH